MLRFLDDCGYQVVIPDHGAFGGLTDKRYLQYESLIPDIAVERGMTPAFFQFVIWAKYSGYTHHADLYQYDA
jgi:thermostable 8-oxoguanine DNA glycosylase